MLFIINPASALHLHIKPMRKHRRQLHRNLAGALEVSLQQSLPDCTSLCATQYDQTCIQFSQPGQLANRLCFNDILGPSARQQLRQIQIALVVLNQYQHARQSGSVLTQAF